LPAIEILLQGSHTNLETEFKDTILSSEYYALQLKANKSELAEDIQKVVQHQKLDSILHKQLILNPYRLCTGTAAMLSEVFLKCPFLFSYETKLLYF
jgi:hypothetical protein